MLPEKTGVSQQKVRKRDPYLAKNETKMAVVKKLVIITIQYDYLKKIMDQLVSVFGDLISLRPIQLNSLSKETISADETVLSAISEIENLVQKNYPEVTQFITSQRSINLANTRELLDFTEKKKILVVSDQYFNTHQVIDELKESGFNHDFVPFTPGKVPTKEIDCVVSTGDIHLVPETSAPIINIGVNVISLETMIKIRNHFKLEMDLVTLSKKFIQSLLVISHLWPVSKRNKYVSSWIGTTKDHSQESYFSDFISKSRAMKDFIYVAKMISQSPNPVHISGEGGVGKRSVAIAIHNESQFRNGVFKYTNCLNRSGVELNKELFGYMEGATYHAGLLEAEHGTICLEEIDSAPAEVQERLGLFLNQKRIVNDAGHEIEYKGNFRIATTSTQKINILFQKKRFSKDLYYTLSLFACHMPSLKERDDDFEAIVRDYLHREIQKPDVVITDEVITILKNHKWEGNVQELFNVLSYLANINQKIITPDLLPFYIPRSQLKPVESLEADVDVDYLVSEIEKNGFLDESLKILNLYKEGKRQNRSYGRSHIQDLLKKEKILLTQQQLRLKLERLDKLGLLTVRQGRSGTTISKSGEKFLKDYKQR